MPPATLTVIFRDPEGRDLATLPLATKQFKTGSRGLFGQAKLEIGGARYQAQVQLVEIGSKPEAAPEA